LAFVKRLLEYLASLVVQKITQSLFPKLRSSKDFNQMEHGIEKLLQGTVYEPGEMIRVIDGPFNDFSGVVEEADNQKGKVKLQ
jgi:transcriptional antiterminator NusG